MRLASRLIAATAIAFLLTTPIAARAQGVNWNGPYLGGQIGGVWTDNTHLLEGVGSLGHTRSTGAIVGLHAGYDWQFGPWVLGPVVDMNYMSTRWTKNSYSVANEWSGNVRARAGYALGDLLPYVTAGVAFGNTAIKPGAPLDNWSTWQAGWVAGAGLDYRLTPRVSIGMVYLHTDLGSNSHNITTGGVPVGFRVRSGATNDAVMARISFRF